MKEQLLQKFGEIFGDTEGAEVYFAPGRVNLIGEHTDYNGGHVFPCALTIGTYGVARKRKDKKLRFYSMNFDRLGVLESSVEKIKPEKEAGWTNYPKGVIWAFGQKGYEVTEGMDLMLFGNIPNGSGLSSSASVEVLTGFILRDQYGFSISNEELALIGQFSENRFNGVNCGIMDQFAIAMGKKDNAIFLDTAAMEFEYAPIRLEGAKLVIACSNKKRGLGDSKYNERRSECETALAQLQQDLDQTNRKKKEALNTFETVTQTIISDEISGSFKAELDQMEADLTGISDKLRDTGARLKEKNLFVTDAYGSYIGREFLTTERLEALETLIRTGEAASITEAVSRYKAKNVKPAE